MPTNKSICRPNGCLGGISVRPEIIAAHSKKKTNSAGRITTLMLNILWAVTLLLGTQVALADGKIIVDKVTLDIDDNPIPSAELFNFRISDAADNPISGFELADISDPHPTILPAFSSGTNYGVEELLPLPTGSVGWYFLEANCVSSTDGSNQNPTGSDGVVLHDGETLTCTFINREKDFVPRPVLTLDKTSNVTTYDAVGDVIIYTYVVANAGNVPLTNVVINDPLPNLSTLACSPVQPSVLNLAESMTCKANYTITQADLNNGSVLNTATADSNETLPVQDSVTVKAIQTPLLKLDKTADVVTYDAVGDIIQYTYIATNAGNISLTQVVISDPLPGLSTLTCNPVQPSTLAPTATMTCNATYTIIQTDLNNGSVLNTATADSNETPPVQDSVTVKSTRKPALKLDKTADVATYDTVGNMIHYTYVATNTGNVPLTNVVISDPLPGLSVLTCNPTQPATLAPTATMTCKAKYSIKQADLNNGSVLNTATADSDETPPVRDSVTVKAIRDPLLTLDKTADITTYDAVGDVIQYTYIVTNTGNISLTKVVISDPLPGLSPLTCNPAQPATLVPTAKMTCKAKYNIKQADLNNGSVLNTATADSNETPAVQDSVAVRAIQTPLLKLEKTSDVATYEAVGDLIEYTFVATNAGNIPLTKVMISDPLPGLSGLACNPAQPATLAPTAKMTCTANYTITQTDADNRSVVNTATADSTETPSVQDSVTIPTKPLLIPALGLFGLLVTFLGLSWIGYRQQYR